MAEASAEDAICARLRGEDVPISSDMIAAARRHRIHLVLAAVARPQELAAGPAAALRAELRTAAMVEMIRERTLARLLDQLASAGVQTLLLKGAGLAHTVYRSACLRPREDVDLLIPRSDLKTVEPVLTACGWMRDMEPDGELMSTQRHYSRIEPSGFRERLDLHWKIAIPQLFADAVGYQELMSRAVPVAPLGPAARTLSTGDALFVACLHRVAHHQDVVNLLWLWDVHLLASRLSAAERERFWAIAAGASMRAVCERGLTLAASRFHTPDATDLISGLQPGKDEAPEPSARFVGGNLRQVDLLRSDIWTLHGWHARFALVGEHLFPSIGYMKSRYPKCPVAALPLAYAHRIVRGAPKWFRRPGAPGSAAEQ